MHHLLYIQLMETTKRFRTLFCVWFFRNRKSKIAWIEIEKWVWANPNPNQVSSQWRQCTGEMIRIQNRIHIENDTNPVCVCVQSMHFQKFSVVKNLNKITPASSISRNCNQCARSQLRKTEICTFEICVRKEIKLLNAHTVKQIKNYLVAVCSLNKL